MSLRVTEIREIIEYHTSVGRVLKTEEEWYDASNEVVYHYHEMIGIEPIPKDQLIKFYEDIANSELGYTEYDMITANSGCVFGLNTYQALESWNYDIRMLGEKSSNYGKDFKDEMAKKYEEAKKTFV